MDVCKDAVVFDLESVPEAEGRKDCFYINARLTPIRIEGASLAEYEQHEDFCTKRVLYNDSQKKMKKRLMKSTLLVLIRKLLDKFQLKLETTDVLNHTTEKVFVILQK